ncbi:hypothetical protein Hanom_Chr02g00138281 [Helianthus anomalus]
MHLFPLLVYTIWLPSLISCSVFSIILSFLSICSLKYDTLAMPKTRTMMITLTIFIC